MTDSVQKKRLLIITDTPTLTTGLARCCRELTKGFIDNDLYEVAVAGWHQTPVRHAFPFFIYPFVKNSEADMQLTQIFNDFRPDVVLCVGDIWDLAPFIEPFNKYKDVNKDVKYIAWITVDGEWIEKSWVEILRPFDAVASFSKFGVKEINNITDRLSAELIYPGVDSETFNKLNKNLFINQGGQQIELNNMFAVINIGQNHDRKNIPLTIEAFSEFQKDKEDVFLFLGTDPRAPSGYNLFAIINRFNMHNKVSIVKDISPVSGVPDNRINLLYNMSKVNVNSSIGEGFGLPILEGMSAGCVPLVTDYASCAEFVEDCGEKIDIAAYVYGAYGVIRAIASKDDLVAKLNNLYNDWKKYKDEENKDASVLNQYSLKCIEIAKKYTWVKTVDRIDKLIKKTLDVKEDARSFVKKEIKFDELKLAIIIPSWGKNCGIAEYTKTLCDNLEKLGTNVTIFPSNDLKSAIEKLSDFNCIYIQHEYSFFQNRMDVESFLDKAREKNIKTVFLLHSFAPLYPYINMLIDKADKIIYHNDDFKKYSMKQRADAKNIEVVPMGCDDVFKADNKDAKSKLGIEDRYPILGSFGFLRDQKGYHELIQATKALKEKYPKILCLIAASEHEFGSKTYDDNFFKFIEDEGIKDNVMIVRDYLDDKKLMQVLNVVDLFVLNYKNPPNLGGNSAAVKTLLRLCKPIIVNDGIAFTDMGDEVLKVRDMDSDKICDAVEVLIENKEKCQELSEKAEKVATQNNWQEVAKKHLKVLND